MAKENNKIKSQILFDKVCEVCFNLTVTNRDNKNLENECNSLLSELYIQSLEDNYYWQYCPATVYISNYNNRKNEYLKNYPDYGENGFIKRELTFIKNNYSGTSAYRFFESSKGTEIELNSAINSYKLNIEFQDFGIEKILNFIDYDLRKKIKISQEKIIEFLEEKLNTEKTENYQRYFTSKKSFKIFTELQQQIVRKKYQLADYSFIYRRMYTDRYIYEGIKEGEFRNFLNKEYKTELFEPLKTISNCTTSNKESIYSMIINSR